MFIFLNYYNISLFLGGLVAILSGAAVYFNDKDKPENIMWMLLNISTAIWSFGYFGMLISNNSETALLNNWILHIGAIFIPFFYLAFIVSLTKTISVHKIKFILLTPLVIFFLIMNTTPNFVKAVFPKQPLPFAPDAGPLYIYFTIYFFATVSFAIWILIKKILSNVDYAENLRFKHIFFSSLFGFIGGGFVFFLTFNILIPPYPIILFTFYPLIIAYAMLKHKLFDVKVVVTEMLTGTIWIVLLFQTLLSENPQEQVVSGFLLILTIIFGFLLIKNVSREIELRERIEKLAQDLELANKQQVNLIHFITHQVKGFFTKSRNIFASLLDGDYGTLAPAGKILVEEGFKSDTKAVETVQQILHASDVKKGTVTYAKQDFDLKQLVTEEFEKEKHAAENNKLDFKINIAEGEYNFNGDKDQLAHVIHNLIDNSIRYTLKGKVTVNLSKTPEKVIFSVKDTGVGITPEDRKNLFKEGGRGKDSVKVNTESTGYGLFIVKGIIFAHQGTIHAESEGHNKGSEFVVELPIK